MLKDIKGWLQGGILFSLVQKSLKTRRKFMSVGTVWGWTVSGEEHSPY